MRVAQITKVSMLLLFVGVSGAWAQAQPSTQTATQFYLDYRKAFDKATKIEDLLPFLAAKNRKQVEDSPKADRDKNFGLMKIMAVTGAKVLKEEHLADGSAVLTVEAINGDKKKVTGKVTILKEGGAWKLGDENWPM
jgi:hypothetical protein